MMISTKEVVTTLDGTLMKVSSDIVLTHGIVIAEALLADTSLPKIKGYSLAHKVYGSDLVEVDDSELALIKKALSECKAYAPHTTLIFGQVLAALEV